MSWGSDGWGLDWGGEVSGLSDVTFDCTVEIGLGGVSRPGVIVLTTAVKPATSIRIDQNTTITVTTTQAGITPTRFLAADSVITVTTSFGRTDPDVYISTGKLGWVWTSRIGALDFDQHASGETWRSPMPYSGLIHQIRKLGNGVIVYGERGITRLTPSGVQWGRTDLHKIGIISKNAATGTDDVHYFVDRFGMLYRLKPGEMPEKMDFTNLMSTLTSDTVMSYDERKKIVYITDNVLGFALTEDGLGKCPVNISGVGWKDGSFYVVAPAAITNSPFEITTDIIDFGVRTEKTISYIELNIDLSADIYVMIESRWNKDDSWTESDWRRVDNYGRASFCETGTEFRINIKLTTYEAIRLDDIQVRGNHPDGKPIGGLAQV
jgi:hypothetical protein